MSFYIYFLRVIGTIPYIVSFPFIIRFRICNHLWEKPYRWVSINEETTTQERKSQGFHVSIFGGELCWSGPIRSDPIRSGPVRSDPIRSDPIRSGPVRSGPVRSDPIRVLPTADPEHWWEIYLVACGFWHGVWCLFERTQRNRKVSSSL